MKLLFLLFFAFMHHISTSLSYDLELEGSVKLEKNFYDMFKTNKPKTQRFADSNQERMISENDNGRKTIISNVINDRPIFRVGEQKDIKIKRRDINTPVPKSEVSNNIHNKPKNNIMSHISSHGNKQIKYMAEKLRNLISPSLDIDNFLPNVTHKYDSDLKRYFNNSVKQIVKNEVERDFYILHVIESTNKIFADACINLLESINSRRNHRVNLDSSKIKLNEEVQKAVIEEKKANLKYVCDTIDVCRIFPAYSDRIAYLLSYIANLKESNFDKVITILTELVESNPKFFSTVIYDDTAPIVILKMKQLSNNPKNVKKLLLDIGRIIYQRFELINDYESEQKTRTTAVRILIDMVDAAFRVLGEDFIEIEFDNIMNDFNDWSKGLSTNLQKSLTEFCSNIEEVLNFFWIPESKNEVKILVDVIVLGTADNTTAMDYLLTKGSKLVRGETALPNAKINLPVE